MKKAFKLLLIIIISTLAISVYPLLGGLFVSGIEKLPAKKTYYYLPEINTYLCYYGVMLFIYDDLGTLVYENTNHPLRQYVSGLIIRSKKSQASLIVHPSFDNTLVIEDPHNCLYPERARGEIIWLANDVDDNFIPDSCYRVSLIPTKKGVHYSLPNGDNRYAIKLSKKIINQTIPEPFPHGFEKQPLNVLKHFKKIDDTLSMKSIYVENISNGLIALHIRDNTIECEPDLGSADMPIIYPHFFYNPSYPSIIFADSYGTIKNRNCNNLTIVSCNWYYNYRLKQQPDCWYHIKLNPFKVEEIN